MLCNKTLYSSSIELYLLGFFRDVRYVLGMGERALVVLFKFKSFLGIVMSDFPCVCMG